MQWLTSMESSLITLARRISIINERPNNRPRHPIINFSRILNHKALTWSHIDNIGEFLDRRYSYLYVYNEVNSIYNT